ncbi:kdtA, waaA [Plasmopara halstedii]|uniref:KdtA, waaA n=1 Tax=Plasmopara halstedii TaxID=4781 RepID=A0A0P1AES8_PLAHL|nr:kdtA, waaA [Plasmopara halstedii]CEG39183.1 kdtA, waaA [Plasmopara halstedii]|eukprot:XP_024575552.1 kdtA, waaA [Plasmopara halstedii]
MPLISWYVRRKDLKRLVPHVITAERFGRSGLPGQKVASPEENFFTIWIHGASIGECLSGLPIVNLALSPKLGQSLPEKKVRVVVSTTTTSARQVVTERLKENKNAICVLAPLDHHRCVERFYDTWKPNVGIWIESELWPTLITEAARRDICIGLVNGRISALSLRLWQLPGLYNLSKSIVGLFSLVLCQDEQQCRRFESLGAKNAGVALNLKFASTRSIDNDDEASILRRAIGDRLACVAGSTHDKEELMLAKVHIELTKRLQNRRLLTMIVPRHPNRAPFIVKQILRQFPKLVVGLRSRDSLPRDNVDLFIVDTMDETHLMYNCVSTAVIGGSFVKRGGHNPIEPLRAGCYVLMGPYMENFADILCQLKLQSRVVNELRSVISAEELIVALENHFKIQNISNSASIASKENQLKRAMEDLAASTLSMHESQLVDWILKSGSRKGTKKNLSDDIKE